MTINTFRAFKNRNYRLYFSGQSMSLIGTWMQKTAVSWLVYSLTHSAFMLGLTMFATQFPTFLFTLLGGIASDRYNRYKVLLLTQVLSLVQAVVLAALILSGHYIVWEILALSVVLGIINAFDVPARQPMVHEMITDKSELANALALNSSMNNLARFMGPALSGIVLEKFGAGVCFSINAVSFVAVIASLLLMKIPPYVPNPVKNKISTELAEGIVYVKNTPSIGIVMLMLTLVSLLVLPYNNLLPIFAKVIFKGDAATFGYINSFIGLGAVGGAFFLASLKPGSDLKVVLLVNTIIFGICLIAFSHTTYFPLAMVFATLCGFGMMSQSTICNTIVQFHSDKNMRGRVMGILVLAVAMISVGNLMTGTVSQKIGAPNTILCQGLIALVIAAIFAPFLTSERRLKKEQLEEDESMAIGEI